MLMRESKETIEKCYREKKLVFSYAANWGDYAKGESFVIEIIFTMSCDKEEYVYYVYNDMQNLWPMKSEGIP